MEMVAKVVRFSEELFFESDWGEREGTGVETGGEAGRGDTTRSGAG